MRETPLTVQVKNGVLTVSIGIDTLAYAFYHSDFNRPFSETTMDYPPVSKVVDAEVFAKAVRLAMLDEGEDGSTPLSRFLDKAMQDAADSGCEGLDED